MKYKMNYKKIMEQLGVFFKPAGNVLYSEAQDGVKNLTSSITPELFERIRKEASKKISGNTEGNNDLDETTLKLYTTVILNSLWDDFNKAQDSAFLAGLQCGENNEQQALIRAMEECDIDEGKIDSIMIASRRYIISQEEFLAKVEEMRKEAVKSENDVSQE